MANPELATNVVGLFPGQGSLSEGVGSAWQSAPSWALVEQISEAADIDVANLLLHTPLTELVRTDRAQIATFALSMVSYAELTAAGVVPHYLLGHSLGEFSSLVAAGLLSVRDGARLIAVRGRAMAAAAQSSAGTMIALMGGDANDRSALSSIDGAWVANINGPGQVVLSGTLDAISYIEKNFKELGWKRATPLAVGGAFHSPLMSEAQADLDRALNAVTWGSTRQVLIANVDGGAHTEPDEWRDLLSRQLTSPVEFVAAIMALPDTVTTTIEMAPGNVLTGLTKRIRTFEHQYAPANSNEVREIVP